MKGAQFQAGFGGKANLRYQDRSIVRIRSWYRSLLSFLSMRYVRFGDSFIKQLQGIPIGGPYSVVILDAIFSNSEVT